MFEDSATLEALEWEGFGPHMFILYEQKKRHREHARKYERSRVTLGSDLRCQVWIPDSGAAGEHVEISERDGKLFLRVMADAEPVRVNEVEIREAPLSNGDRIGIGSAEFRIQGPFRTTPSRLRWRWFLGVAMGLLMIWIGADRVRRAPKPETQPLNRETVRNPADRAALPVPEAIPTIEAASPAPIPLGGEDPDEQAQRILAHAQSQIAQGQLADADQVLSQLQNTYSDYLPAYAERAALFERRGLRGQAQNQWMEILQRAQDAEQPETHRAAAALSRLALQDFPKHPPPPVPKSAPVTQPGPQPAVEIIRILSSNLRRLPPSPDSDDVRILEIHLELSRESPAVALEDVSVLVRFYDRTDHNGRVRPSSIQNNPQTQRPGTGLWMPATARQVTATYVVPRGLRKRDQQKFGGPTVYYGYTVEVRVGNSVRVRLVKPAQLDTSIYGKR